MEEENDQNEPWWIGLKPTEIKQPWKVIENPVKREQYKQRLAFAQNAEDAFPTSHGKENPDWTRDSAELSKKNLEYSAELKEYSNLEHESDEMSEDLWIPKNPNIGHKLHLNVAVKNVRAVSEYLIRKKIQHKYLYGGEIEDGKIFTIYTGSKDITDKIAGQISRDIGEKLCKPVDLGEIEYAPNIVGRFTGQIDEFHKYGSGVRGISILREYARMFLGGRNKQHLPLAFNNSYDRLADRYGEYFYGSNV